MKTYICSNCGYEIEVDNTFNFVCPKCGNVEQTYKKSENELDAIIDSVVEDSLQETNSNIINENEKQKYINISSNNSLIIRNDDKCINCGQCKKACEKLANIKYDMKKCNNPICTSCGACVINCPSGALSFKQNYKELKQIIDLNEKIVVAIVDPCVYADISCIVKDKDVESVFVGSLKHIGFDYVFNGAFSKDLSTLEEVTEFAERLKNKKLLPMITSSCNSWINYVQIYHSELLENVSSCKNPLQMQSAIIKHYFSKEKGFDESKIVTVSISNCTSIETTTTDKLNVDYNITTSELMCLYKDEELDINNVSKKEYDNLLSESSGSGYLTSVTGGESESFVRTFYRIMKRDRLKKDEIDFLVLRNINGIREASLKIGDYQLRIAIVEGLNNFEKLMINDKYKRFHYIEVMNCIGGCANGCGRLAGTENLDKNNYYYSKDQEMSKRCSHDNKEIKDLYSKFLSKPMSEKCLEILHKSHNDNSKLLEDK